MLRGCDISEFQTVGIDLSPYEFAIIRSSYGVGERDKSVYKHADNALKAGKLIGFYHYAYPDFGNSPEDEAETMLGAIEKYLGRCLIALDWEGKATDYPAGWAMSFLDYVHAKTGVTPLFYTFAAEAKRSKYKDIAAKYPLWIAHWRTAAPDTGVWNNINVPMWQWADNPIDQDIFEGTKEDWLKMCKGEKGMTEKEFAGMMDNWLKAQAKKGVSSWAKEDVEDIIDNKIMVGSDKENPMDSFRPQAFVTRQELAVALNSMRTRDSSGCCKH